MSKKNSPAAYRFSRLLDGKDGSDATSGRLSATHSAAKSGLNEELMQKRDDEEDSDDARDDPFYSYGQAIVSYFKLQKSLLWAFAVLFVLAGCQMAIFWSQGGLDFLHDTVPKTVHASFGNMG